MDIKEQQRVARKEIQDEQRVVRAKKIKALQEYDLDHTCDFCRDLQHGQGDGTRYGLLSDGHTIKCPQCGTCFWSDES